MKKELALVTGGSGNLLGPAAVLFLSIKHRSKSLFLNTRKVFFLDSSSLCIQNEQDLKVLDSLGVEIIFYDPREFSSDYSPYFTSGISSKFVPFKYLFDVQSILWLDSDQVCSSSLDFFLSVYQSGTTASALFLDGGLSIAEQFLPESLDQVAMKYPSVDLSAHGMCGSVWMFTKPKPDMYSQLQEIYNNLSGCLRLPDQAVFDVYASLHTDDLSLSWLISPSRFTPHPSSVSLTHLQYMQPSLQPYLIHSYGYYKFWNRIDYPLWNYYYKIYLERGGKPFKISSYRFLRVRLLTLIRNILARYFQ